MEIDKELYIKCWNDPIFFIERAFWLKQQKVLPEYEWLLEDCRRLWDYSNMKLSMFEPFVKYEMLSWQQVEIVLAVARAVTGTDKKKIAVRSGHWIGKSSIISMIMIWFLFCYMQSIIGCTAPTFLQLHDVLWKELQQWKDRLPEWIKDMFEWSNDYLRVWITKEHKSTRFARARTATKEKPEALAWLHAEDLMLVIDEASWVDDAIFETSQSAGTNKNAIFLMISNPTRLEWYFYEAFHDNKNSFQTLRFNSEQSPLVDKDFVEWIIADYGGTDTDQYRVRVLWEFPKSWLMDDKWWIPLFDPNEIQFVDESEVDPQLKDYNVLWIDPAGNGKDFTSFVARNMFYAQRLARQQKSDENSIAIELTKITDRYKNIPEDKIFYDNFWVWANVWTEVAKSWMFVRWVNVWNEPDDKNTFFNKRAECYRRLKMEFKSWLKLIWTKDNRKDLFMIKYRTTDKWLIRIMSKIEMRKEYWKSPDDADALMLTFWDANIKKKSDTNRRKERVEINPFTGEIVNKKNLSNNTYELW